MKKLTNTTVIDGITRRDGLLSLLGSAMALAGCGGGGGGGVASVTSGGTGSFSSGPITGFGSIIVGGIRFDDSTARTVLDVDDDNRDLRGNLRLGMMVRVTGKPTNALRAEAETIEVRSELLGPIDSIPSPQTTPPTLVVLGQTVQITATTIFEEGLSGVGALVAGTIVEVHGFVDPVTNRISATRIERKVLSNVKAFKLQGIVSALDNTAKTIRIGPLTINFTAPVDIPASLTLANGLLVRVRLATTPATGTRKALRIRAVEAELEVEDRNEAEVEGTITAFTSTSRFSVNGQQVNASNAAFSNGTTGIVLGARVEVEGSLVNGVLVAKKVELKDERNDNDPLKFELNGTVSALNTTAKTFVLRGVTVNYAATTDIRPTSKTVANLVNGVSVEVKGVASTDGTRVNATRLSFE